jgi:hypothetical protein
MLRVAIVAAAVIQATAPAQYQERDFLSRVRRLTVEGRRGGDDRNA